MGFLKKFFRNVFHEGAAPVAKASSFDRLSEDELEAFHGKYLELAEAGREEIRSGAADTGTPTIQFPSPS